MTEHLIMSGDGEHPSLLKKASGPWSWQCMYVCEGHTPYRGQPDDM